MVSGCTSGRNAIWCDTIVRFKRLSYENILKVLMDFNVARVNLLMKETNIKTITL